MAEGPGSVPGPSTDGGVLSECHVENLGVAVVRRTVLVAVARGHPHAAVRGRFDGTQPAERALEEGLHVGQAAAADDLAVEPGATLTGDVEHVADDGDAAARARGHRVGVLGRDESGGTARARGALTRWPAVVPALLDEVGLVHDAVAELLLPQPALRVEGQALRVAVAVAPHRVAERVVRRDGAVRLDAQYLAVEPVLVLGVGAVLRVTGAGEQELAVGAEPQPAAVVELVAQDAGEQYLLGTGHQRVGDRVVLDPDDPVVRRRRVHDVQPVVAAEGRRVDLQAAQAAFATGALRVGYRADVLLGPGLG